jgi:hypothetical protein
METSSTVQPVATRLNLVSRLRAVFTNPRRLVEALRAEPRTLGVLLLFVLIWNLFSALTFEYTLDTFVDQVYSLPNVPSDQQEKVATWLEDHRATVQVLHHLGLTVSWIAAVLIWAGLLHLSAGMFFEAPQTPIEFRHSLALVSHANLVNLPHGLITTVLTLVTQKFFRSLSLGALLGTELTSPLGTALEWVTPFNLWWIAILGIGCAVFYGQSWRRSVIVPLGVSLVFRIIQVAMSAFAAAGSR